VLPDPFTFGGGVVPPEPFFDFFPPLWWFVAWAVDELDFFFFGVVVLPNVNTAGAKSMSAIAMNFFMARE
jgi:hypothetical protein